MRVTSIQLGIKDRTKEENLDSVLKLLDEAPESDLFILPELWPCGFFSFDRYERDSETLDGPIVQAMREKALELKTFVMMGSIVEREGEDLFNTSILLDPHGQIIGTYRKIHLFGYQSEERRLLKPGKDLGIADLPWGKAGITTCYDLRFPELYRKMMDQGIIFIIVPSAWPHSRLEAWLLFNQARALENLSYLFSCNCAGSNAGQMYAGHSMIVDPLGRVLAQGGGKGCIVSAEIDPELAAAVREEFSFLNDRIFRRIEKS